MSECLRDAAVLGLWLLVALSGFLALSLPDGDRGRSQWAAISVGSFAGAVCCCGFVLPREREDSSVALLA